MLLEYDNIDISGTEGSDAISAPTEHVNVNTGANYPALHTHM